MKAIWVLSLAVCLTSANLAMAQTTGAPAAAPSSGDYAAALMNLDCPTCEGKVESLRGFTLATPGSAHSATAAPRSSASVDSPAQRAVAPHSAAMRVATRAASPAAPHVSAGDLMITFKLGSAELTEQGTANAHNFAGALNDPRLSGQAFLIVGHTDATGSPERNMALSEQRAEAVKAYLVKQGVDAGRLQTKGRGSEELANPAAPAAAANRRVEVKRAG